MKRLGVEKKGAGRRVQISRRVADEALVANKIACDSAVSHH